VEKKQDLLEGSVGKHMMRLSVPSIGGMLAITIFNITDTYFVSRIGTEALAAMGFTFPVVMVVSALATGISLGATSILARAFGSGNHHLMKRIATDGILLSVLTVILVSILGLLTMDTLFRFMGAEGKTLELVKTYMSIWYAGAFVVIIPPVSDGCMRAVGDMIRPLLVMIVCAVMNFILDPILIFGLFGAPAMGIEGAAIATLISRAFGMILTLSFVHFHYHLIDFKYESFNELISSWKSILTIGLPNVVVRLLPQIMRGALTKMAAMTMGVTAVAAIAAGTKVESFATVVSMAVGTAIVPIIGQNFGAKKYERIEEVRQIISKFAVIYGVFLFLISFVVAEPLSKIFTDEPEVIRLTVTYLRIVFLGTIGLNLYNWTSESLNAIGKPMIALKINTIGTLGLILPMVIIGARQFGYEGMLIGLSISQIIVGMGAYHIGKTELVPEIRY